MRCVINLLLSDEKRHTKAMLKAVDKARQPVWINEAKESKTNGLRVIRRFERVNKTTFNPFSKRHVELIYGNASHEAFFRRAKSIIARANSHV